MRACRLRFANESGVNVVAYAHEEDEEDEDEDDFRHELFCLQPGDEQFLGLRAQATKQPQPLCEKHSYASLFSAPRSPCARVAAHAIGLHVFTFIFDDNEETAIEHEIDTDLPDEGQSRVVRMVARDGGDGQIHVEDSVVGNCSYPEGAGATGSDAAEDDSNNGARGFDPVEEILSWRAPTIAESERRCADMLQASPVRDTTKETPPWEQRLRRLVEEQERRNVGLVKLASQEEMQAVVEQPVRNLYRLRLTNLKTKVLHPPPNSRDVQVVYDRPYYGEQGGKASKELGREERSIIEVEFEKDGWLRYRPQPGDQTQCWVKKSATNGRWELAPTQGAAQVQMEFFVESSLEMLTCDFLGSGTSGMRGGPSRQSW